MLRIGVSRVRQHVRQQTVRHVLRPAHRLGGTGIVLDQAVDDLLRWGAHR
jgi:hypothetical protein